MGLQNFLTEIIGAKVIISLLKKQDPGELAKETADVVDKILDEQLGDKKSENVQSVLVPWLEKFIKKFNEQLLVERNENV